MIRPSDSDERTLGNQVRRLRGERGLTRHELAEKAGVSVDTLNRIERGRVSPSLETIAKVCNGLRVSLETFFSMLEPDASDAAKELCDFLNGLPPQEVSKVRRLFDAMFEGGSEGGNGEELALVPELSEGEKEP